MSRKLQAARSFWITVAVSLSACCQAGDDSVAVATTPDSSPVELTLNATILLPDGRPAAGAVVHSHDNFIQTKRTVQANASGTIELKDSFLSGMRIHALSADGHAQSTLLIPDAAVRSLLLQPVTIQLEPATTHRIMVTSDGQPVENAHVTVSGDVFQQTSVTQSDGTTVVSYPSGERISSVTAWHPQKGVNGTRFRGTGSASESTELSLLTPGPHVIRILDGEKKPVPGLSINASVRPADGEWIMARSIDATRATTDENGEVRYDWFPKSGTKYVDVELLDPGWKEDDTEIDKIPDGLTIVHARKRIPATGRVVFPEGVDPQGVMITGFGFGTGDNGDIFRARVRKDGTFSTSIPAVHGYVLGVSDLEWSSEIWSGVILPLEDEPQNELMLDAYPATIVEFFVTRGSSRMPVANAWINLNRRGDVKWTDDTGETHRGGAGIDGWLRTDDKGFARTGVGRGDINVRLTSDDWSEIKDIQVKSSEAMRVEFHREWLGDRLLTAAPKTDAAGYVLPSDAVALAWTERSPEVDKIHRPEIVATGVVEVRFDENLISLLVLDRKNHVSGFSKAGAGDYSVDLPMRANATYSGTLVDRRDQAPLAHREVRLITDSSFLDVVERTRTDEQGQFAFVDVPAGVPLRLSIGNERGQSEYFLFGGDRLFEPGEHRTGDVAKAALMNGNSAVDDRPVEKSIAKRIAGTVRNCAPMGMRTVVVLAGDDSQRATLIAGRLCNTDEVEAMLRYLPVNVTARQRLDDVDWMASMNWPMPEAGEVMLVVTADGRESSASLRIDCSDVEAAFRQGVEFLNAHAPTVQDGREKLKNAKAEATRSNRALWVICGGPRCGPCFRLARWIHEHHELLEKDLVIVKLTSGLDRDADEIFEEIGGAAGDGIPFHSMMSPEGEVLISSKGPLGNIGMPSEIEGQRHFQAMLEAARRRMTAEEIDGLIDSLREKD